MHVPAPGWCNTPCNCKRARPLGLVTNGPTSRALHELTQLAATLQAVDVDELAFTGCASLPLCL